MLHLGGLFSGHDYVDSDDVRTPVRQRYGKQDWSVNPDGSRRIVCPLV